MVQKVIFWTLSAAKVMTMLMMLETNIEKITPMRMIVLVESDRSSLYESPRMTSSEPNANKIAITIVPANGKPVSVTPKAMAQTAPSDAPDETPSVEPSASGFLSSPCIAAPARDRAAPVSATHSTRGSRMGMMDETSPSGSAPPVSFAAKNASVSPSGTRTLPMQTQRHSTASVTTANRRYSQSLNVS